MARLKQFWIGIKNNFWFIPTLIIIALILVAIGVIGLDRMLALSKQRIPFPVSFERDAVRTFLATIAGSMMTIAGVVFSITILVLAQTAGQYTSRVLRNFMGKKSNQAILGIFVGIFIFCLFLITNLHPTDNALTALSGFLFALIGVGFLIFYIHQTSLSIQASEILRNIEEETMIGIHTFYQKPYEEKEIPHVQFELPYQLLSQQIGHLQAIDHSAMLAIAIEFDTKIAITKKVGDFIAVGEEIANLEKDNFCDEHFKSRLYRAIVIGKYRTAEEDVAYGVQQIVDMALRGLSSGINDLSTTQGAIDYLRSIYIKLANQDFGSPIHYHEEKPIMIAPIHTFASLLELGFTPICFNAKNQPTIQAQINDSIEEIQKITKSEKRKALLERFKCGHQK